MPELRSSWAVSTTYSGIVTLIGLALAVGGVVCGVKAFVETLHEHDPTPVFPGAARQLDRARALLQRRKRVHAAEVHMTSTGQATVTVTSGGGAHLTVGKADESVDERFARLEAGLAKLAAQMIAGRAEVQGELDRATKRIVEQGDRLDVADAGLRALAKSVAVSTARLQLWGLILVGCGTVLMAVPAIVAVFVV
ncbi:hypothetical protein PSU4_60900 [Pseudonocardia sulfidoxydans NBRC 16205]|uniref:Uncharacterized protein n=1 Tax=Pseudonocardia sulfidoxydans NBRC 16205 TaxID=1223511 RepID=A0A511DQL2_9PSEU|nr:hypothetical protein PSU4_60900 [Pseudonocardia sulfidoxydans NBRC 16205]